MTRHDLVSRYPRPAADRLLQPSRSKAGKIINGLDKRSELSCKSLSASRKKLGEVT